MNGRVARAPFATLRTGHGDFQLHTRSTDGSIYTERKLFQCDDHPRSSGHANGQNRRDLVHGTKNTARPRWTREGHSIATEERMTQERARGHGDASSIYLS